LSAELTKNTLLQTVFFGDFAHWVDELSHLANSDFTRTRRERQWQQRVVK